MPAAKRRTGRRWSFVSRRRQAHHNPYGDEVMQVCEGQIGEGSDPLRDCEEGAHDEEPRCAASEGSA